jgi:aspartyl protease family protein
MATGFMMNRMDTRRAHSSLFALCCACCRAGRLGGRCRAWSGLFPGKAVLVIDGGAPRTVPVGANVGGVRLLAVDQDSATVDIGGKRQRLAIGQHAHSRWRRRRRRRSTSLTADGRGHFITTGTVNGATDPLHGRHRRHQRGPGRFRCAPRQCQPGQCAAGNGADGERHDPGLGGDPGNVRVGESRLNEVEGIVHQHDMPMALLGMSFLNRMEMKRDGQTMTLRKRY